MIQNGMKWSPLQQDIFAHLKQGDGNLVVRARAGTGKTTTILEGMRYVQKTENVLLCAFNKKIATELEDRLAKLKPAAKVEAKTLHSSGFMAVKKAFGRVRVNKWKGYNMVEKAILETHPKMEREKRALKSLVARVSKLVSIAKGVAPFATDEDLQELALDFQLTPEESSPWTLQDFTRWAMVAMAHARNLTNEVDFDDMVWLPVVEKIVRPIYSMVVVDECQDMNASQILLAQGMCKKDGRIIVVGDDKQAIYAFRGADSGSLDRLKEELNAIERPLSITYRCGSDIVASVKHLVEDYEAAEGQHKGEVIEETPEGMFRDAKPGDAILSRKNAPLSSIAMRFLKEGRKVRIEGRDIGQGLIKMVKGFNVGSIGALLESLVSWKASQIERLEKANGRNMETRIGEVEDKAEVLEILALDMPSIKALIDRLESLFADSKPGEYLRCIVCSSVHKAKGLEWNRVYGLVNTLSDRNQEEKNIEYVMRTRAKNAFAEVTYI